MKDDERDPTLLDHHHRPPLTGTGNPDRMGQE
jgi:hypothetical protein